eukprot:286367_1
MEFTDMETSLLKPRFKVKIPTFEDQNGCRCCNDRHQHMSQTSGCNSEITFSNNAWQKDYSETKYYELLVCGYILLHIERYDKSVEYANETIQRKKLFVPNEIKAIIIDFYYKFLDHSCWCDVTVRLNWRQTKFIIRSKRSKSNSYGKYGLFAGRIVSKIPMNDKYNNCIKKIGIKCNEETADYDLRTEERCAIGITSNPEIFLKVNEDELPFVNKCVESSIWWENEHIYAYKNGNTGTHDVNTIWYGFEMFNTFEVYVESNRFKVDKLGSNVYCHDQFEEDVDYYFAMAFTVNSDTAVEFEITGDFN